MGTFVQLLKIVSIWTDKVLEITITLCTCSKRCLAFGGMADANGIALVVQSGIQGIGVYDANRGEGNSNTTTSIVGGCKE